MNADQIREKIDSLRVFIEDAEIALRDGKIADLSGLDRQVAMICGRAVGLPPDQARDLQPLMAGLISELDRLGSALKDYRDDLKSRK